MKDILLKKIKELKADQISETDFLKFIQNLPFSDEKNIKLDFHRKFRRGLPEVIYGKDKRVDQLESIIQKFNEVGESILITRVNPEKFKSLKKKHQNLVYHSTARIITFNQKPKVLFKGRILILSAGSSDESVAEEAFVSARYLGNLVDREYDVGVACLPRILSLQSRLNDYSVIIVVAGMEGALPSVIAGLTAAPVIAVPTSVGYGASFEGLAALLTMLNSCSGGISVVNIDNGFGAAFYATLVNQKITTGVK